MSKFKKIRGIFIGIFAISGIIVGSMSNNIVPASAVRNEIDLPANTLFSIDGTNDFGMRYINYDTRDDIGVRVVSTSANGSSQIQVLLKYSTPSGTQRGWFKAFDAIKNITPQYICSLFGGSRSRLEGLIHSAYPNTIFFGPAENVSLSEFYCPLVDRSQFEIQTQEQPTMTTQAQPQQFAPQGYQILKPLGQGLYGSCYEVMDQFGRHYCMKQVDISEIVTPKFAEKEVNMLQLISNLNSPYFLKHHESFYTKDGTKLYIVMELAEGEDLIAFTPLPKLNKTTILEILIRMLESIGQLEKEGIVHKDIKRNNIIINPQNFFIKVIDYGLSVKLRANGMDEDSDDVDDPDPFVHHHMAPEMHLKSKYIGRSDIWSLGILFHELLTEKSPFVFNLESCLTTDLNLSFLYNNLISTYGFSSNDSSIIAQNIEGMLQKDPCQRITANQAAYNLTAICRRIVSEQNAVNCKQ
ncbi:MAG: serine/threonine-protein kinase [Oscillospiraceae bacterium]|nr:serine/threonine-protein kinase [Oscillospiraceae bacterium]